jgi:hypothetical protein
MRSKSRFPFVCQWDDEEGYITRGSGLHYEVRLPGHDQFNYLAGFKDTPSITEDDKAVVHDNDLRLIENVVRPSQNAGLVPELD